MSRLGLVRSGLVCFGPQRFDGRSWPHKGPAHLWAGLVWLGLVVVRSGPVRSVSSSLVCVLACPILVSVLALVLFLSSLACLARLLPCLALPCPALPCMSCPALPCLSCPLSGPFLRIEIDNMRITYLRITLRKAVLMVYTHIYVLVPMPSHMFMVFGLCNMLIAYSLNIPPQ